MSERAARQCGGKKRFESERRALVAAKKTQRHCGVQMRAYDCPFCQGWHYGAAQVHQRSSRELPRKLRYVQERHHS